MKAGNSDFQLLPSAGRTLLITHGNVALRLAIPPSAESALWHSAASLRDEFLFALRALEKEPAPEFEPEGLRDFGGWVRRRRVDEEDATLFAAFMAFAADKKQSLGTSAGSAIAELLLVLIREFRVAYLGAQNIHSLAVRTSDPARLLHWYILAVCSAGREGPLDGFETSPISSSGLFTDGTHEAHHLTALFGGQGTNLHWFPELLDLYQVHSPLLDPFLVQMSDFLNRELSAAEECGLAQTYASLGVNVRQWLRGPSSTVPSSSYLASVPIAAPMIGLTQLCHFFCLGHMACKGPGELARRMSSATGHSQGLVVAAAIAASTSDDDFVQNAHRALKLLFWMALRAAEARPLQHVPGEVVTDCLERGEGTSSSMLLVRGLPRKILNEVIEATNAHLDQGDRICVSLANTPTAFVAAGRAQALCGLVRALRTYKTDSAREGRPMLPFSHRSGAEVKVKFLPIGVAFHSANLSVCVDKILQWDLQKEDSWSGTELRIPVYDSIDGSDIRSAAGLPSETSITQVLAEHILVQPVDWPGTMRASIDGGTTHFLDFGLGGQQGIGRMSEPLIEGRGARTIVINGELKVLQTPQVFRAHGLGKVPSWQTQFAPSIKVRRDGSRLLSTRFGTLLGGKPPIMVAAMTPTTVSSRFVAAVLNAGYHVELAGGGIMSEAQLQSKVEELTALLKPGHALTLNSMWLTPKYFNMHLSSWIRLKRQGWPIDGFTIAGGIPSLSRASEIISQLAAAGFRHIAFKPSNISAIRDCLAIADANPTFPVVIQWTGGRAGGHHSPEDLFEPLVRSYAGIRARPNVSLVVGGGLGSPHDLEEWTSGDWSIRLAGTAMPVDGILVASSVMAAAEAETSAGVKDLIVATPGCSDAEWAQSYERPIGGVVTVISEFGAPIHILATRMALLWKELDQSVFSLDTRTKQRQWLQRHRDEVIARIERDHCKAWFCKRRCGAVLDGLAEMTYHDVLARFFDLVFARERGAWKHISWATLGRRLIRRCEERLASLDRRHEPNACHLLRSGWEEDPHGFLGELTVNYPSMTCQKVGEEDAAWFAKQCLSREYRPVPFIPTLDEDFETFFKKDTLWHSEHVAGVEDLDPQRCVILQGPVAARHTTKANVPIKEILDNCCKSVLLRHVSPLPLAPAMAQSPPVDVASAVSAMLSAHPTPWLHDVLTAQSIVQGKMMVRNQVRCLFDPSLNLSYSTELTGDGAIRTVEAYLDTVLMARCTFDEQTAVLCVSLFEGSSRVADGQSSLDFFYQHRAEERWAPLHEMMAGRAQRIKAYFHALWCGEDVEASEGCHPEHVFEDQVTASAEAVQTAQNTMPASMLCSDDDTHLSASYAFVLGWKSIAAALLSSVSDDDDLLKLVHSSNTTRRPSDSPPIRIGDTVRCVSRVSAVQHQPAGKMVTVVCSIYGASSDENDTVLAMVESAFLFRSSTAAGTEFSTQHATYRITPDTDESLAVLSSRPWIQWSCDYRPDKTHTLELTIESNTQRQERGATTLSCTGEIFKVAPSGRIERQVGRIAYTASSEHGEPFSPVKSFLTRYAKDSIDDVSLAKGPYAIGGPVQERAPSSNLAYSRISGDGNPIHTNPVFAAWADLPTTITHGMFTYALAFDVVAREVTRGRSELIEELQVSFLDIVKPGDLLSFECHHEKMRGGSRVVRIEAHNSSSSLVLRGLACVRPPKRAYVFTGQGSQSQNMCQTQYTTSAVARKVWNDADQHCIATYGFSLLRIVRENPKQMTIHLRGTQGAKVRRRYLQMKYDARGVDGNARTTRLFPDLESGSTELTFHSESGLLSLTQFAQLAVVTFALASWELLQRKQLVHPDFMWAGHSAGEFAALAAVARIFSQASLLDIMWWRGMLMQRGLAVQARELPTSYAMAAVNPSKVGVAPAAPSSFDEAKLHAAVESTREFTGLTCEVVNYNVPGEQYVVSGHKAAIAVLARLLEEDSDGRQCPRADVIRDVVKGPWSERMRQELDAAPLLRTSAVTPLPNISMPFHSSLLSSAVSPLRDVLRKHLSPATLDVSRLVGTWVPNLTGIPFEVSIDHARTCLRITGASAFHTILRRDWSKIGLSQSLQAEVAAELVTEILAQQLASPVRWIDTQRALFGPGACLDLVEIGAKPILCNMGRSVANQHFRGADQVYGRSRLFLSTAKDEAVLYHHPPPASDPPESPPSRAATAEVSPPLPPKPKSDPIASLSPRRPTIRSSDGSDEALPTLLRLRLLIAAKLRQRLEDVEESMTLSGLAGGKSTLQNEIAGDLDVEFGGFPERGEEKSLEALSALLKPQERLGTYSSGLIAKLLSRSMPPSLTSTASVRSMLIQAFGLGPLRCDAVLLCMLSNEPKQRLKDGPAAEAWMTEQVRDYARTVGLKLTELSHETDGDAAALPLDNRAFNDFKAKQELFNRRLTEGLRASLPAEDEALSHDDSAQAYEGSDTSARLTELYAELGDDFVDLVKPAFDPLLVRTFDSAWCWARQALHTAFASGHLGRDATLTQRRSTLLGLATRLDEENRHDINFILQSQKGSSLHPEARRFFEVLIECKGKVLPALASTYTAAEELGPVTEMDNDGKLRYLEVPRPQHMSLSAQLMAKPQPAKLKRVQRLSNRARPRSVGRHGAHVPADLTPPATAAIEVRWANASPRPADSLMQSFQASLRRAQTGTLAFSGRNVLLTGAGQHSIAAAMLPTLLRGGARVIVTTSSYGRDSLARYLDQYRQYSVPGSSLVVAPFNAASSQDAIGLIDWIYSGENRALDLDYVLPFAALAEDGQELHDIGAYSEAAHRAMLTNVLRMLGRVFTHKSRLGTATRPAQVVLPLSPNHGVFGHDGLYAESKLGLESLLQKCGSESWKDYLMIAGAIIGWTRGTGLMQRNNLTAMHFERLHPAARTFSTEEMSSLLLAVMADPMLEQNRKGPIVADFGGKFAQISALGERLKEARSEMHREAARRRAVAAEDAEEATGNDVKARNAAKAAPSQINPRSIFNASFPKLPESTLTPPDDAFDPKDAVVIVGYGEVGPYGSSRTRWEMESGGDFSLEGYLELAFLLGFARFVKGNLADSTPYVGWADMQGNPIEEHEIAKLFGTQIRSQCGIRPFESAVLGGYNPHHREAFHEVVLSGSMPRIQVSAEDAAFIAAKYGDKVTVRQSDGDSNTVQLHEGAEVLISKVGRFSRFVGGLIPTGWGSTRLGVPKSKADSIDQTALWALTTAADVFASAGLEDPYELYAHVHVTEVGNTIGSAMGGLGSMEKMYIGRKTSRDVNKDVLQETFINTIGAWLQLSLLSSCGPVYTPSAACATAAVSLALAKKAILDGEAKVMLCGGLDDLTEASSVEFANMGATNNDANDAAHGRRPCEASRPMSDSRGGFCEAQGGGMQLLARGDVALELGLPIYGVVALAATATDKQSQSVPAPGQGLLSLVSHTPRPLVPRSVAEDQFESAQLLEWFDWRLANIMAQRSCAETTAITDELHWNTQVSGLVMELRDRQAKLQQRRLSSQAQNDSPLALALASQRLGVDDISFISFHGTSTKAGDINECQLHHQALEALGRSPGNPAFVVPQKWLVGHSKGGAAAWAVNGALQSFSTGVVPGNRNLDNADPALQRFSHLQHLSQSLELGRDALKACLVTSMGFGQAGAEICLVNPHHYLTHLSQATLDRYKQRCDQREAIATARLQRRITQAVPWVQLKEAPPYSPADFADVVLDKSARAELVEDAATGERSFRIPSRPAVANSDCEEQRLRHGLPSLRAESRRCARRFAMRWVPAATTPADPCLDALMSTIEALVADVLETPAEDTSRTSTSDDRSISGRLYDKIERRKEGRYAVRLTAPTAKYHGVAELIVNIARFGGCAGVVVH